MVTPKDGEGLMVPVSAESQEQFCCPLVKIISLAMNHLLPRGGEGLNGQLLLLF